MLRLQTFFFDGMAGFVDFVTKVDANPFGVMFQSKQVGDGYTSSDKCAFFHLNI